MWTSPINTYGASYFWMTLLTGAAVVLLLTSEHWLEETLAFLRWSLFRSLAWMCVGFGELFLYLAKCYFYLDHCSLDSLVHKCFIRSNRPHNY